MQSDLYAAYLSRVRVELVRQGLVLIAVDEQQKDLASTGVGACMWKGP
ncbi:hypothetical protein QF026_003443 [Streptomyces aurantiacus]|nr:hypothetical protein [Streptomyces aurantiacus]